MKLSESLKVLPFLEAGKPVDLESVSEKSKMEKKKVRQAIALLEKSAVIAESHKRLKLHVQHLALNGQGKIRGSEK